MSGRRGGVAGAMVALAAGIALGVAPGAQAAQDDAVYGLANGCYTLQANGRAVVAAGDGFGLGDPAAAEPFRFKAVTLGRFMLLGKGGRLLAAEGDRAGATTQPGPAADFTLDHQGDAFTLTATGSGKGLAPGAGGDGLALGTATPFAIAKADGCDAFPEAEVNAEGPVYKGPTSYGETRGYVDAHMHMMGFEFLGGEIHCGKPWDAYGITVALKGCDRTQLGNAPVETFLAGEERFTADPVGWPTFKDWPKPRTLTHEQSYYKWLERSWRAGQRLFVNLFVENHALCSLYPYRKPGYNCNEMDSVRRQAKDLKNLERYIDAQNGGPGKGWFRIVSDPFEARRVINAGKMAIVPGIEVSDLFDCGLKNGVSKCTTEDVDRRLDEAYNELGVRDMELINKFNNGFGGVAGDGGTTGVLVNVGNFTETGRFWDMKPCTGPAEESDHEQYGIGELLAPLADALPAGSLPVYGPGPHCNTMGLTTLGDHLVRRMIEKRMIIDPDHLDVVARKQLLSIVESKGYSGIVSSHSWSTADAYPRIYKMGGFVSPYAGGSAGFVRQWKKLKKERDKRFFWGIGWGADMNGFGGQGEPRIGAPNPVKYPFKSWDGKVTLDRQKTGERTFDINKDGVAHYGLYPDWVEDLRMQAGDEIVDDLTRASEAYLQMWERAIGIRPSDECRSARLRFRGDGLGEVPLATPAEDVLRSAGQPRSRGGRTWRYCVGGRAGGRVSVVFTKAGTSGLIASTAPRHRVAGVGAGSRAARLRGARALGGGVVTRSAGKGRRYVFGVRGGRVRFAGVAAAGVGDAELRRELRLAGLAK